MSLNQLRFRRLLNVFVASALIMCSAIALEAQDVRCSSYALTQAEAYFTRIRTTDYSFHCSHYEHPIRIRSNGIMIRCDFRIPTGIGPGEIANRSYTYAFNGKIYQNESEQSKMLTCSRTPTDFMLMSGPCWNPLEFAFRWCRTKDTTFSWQGLQTPSTWDVMRKLANPECQDVTLELDGESIECDLVTFSCSSEVTSKVYLARDRYFIPVKSEVYNSSAGISGPVFTMTVDKLVRVGERESTIWFPITISASQESIKLKDNPKDTGYKLSYRIDPSSVHVNEDIEDSVFTLETDGMLVEFLEPDALQQPEPE